MIWSFCLQISVVRYWNFTPMHRLLNALYIQYLPYALCTVCHYETNYLLINYVASYHKIPSKTQTRNHNKQPLNCELE
jgi:hypothetical protein